jgi:hypothetical protein
MKRAIAIAAVAGFALGGLVAFAYYIWPPFVRDGEVPTPSRPVWTEAHWPFAVDEWGKGKAFRCEAANCGVEVNLYIRAKIGFCNCTTGVSDDEELDRISDYDLLGNKLAAQGPGREIKVAWMNGRSRAFKVGGAPPAGQSALSVGFNDHCDAIVATAVHGAEQSTAVEPVVLEFLNSKTVIGWAEVALGL